MRPKMLEIKDIGKTVSVMAIEMTSTVPRERYLLERIGYSQAPPAIALIWLLKRRMEHDPNEWVGLRIMKVAHKYIIENWNEIKTGDTIDVVLILEMRGKQNANK